METGEESNGSGDTEEWNPSDDPLEKESLEDYDSDENTSTKKVPQKRAPADPSNWKRAIIKDRVNKGMSYTNNNGVLVPAKVMKDPCAVTCMKKCQSKITYEQRHEIFIYFYALGDKKLQWDYIGRHTNFVPIERFRLNSRRTTTRHYFLAPVSGGPSIKVCKTMFMNTLVITAKWVDTVWQKFNKTNATIEPDRRGRYSRTGKPKVEIVETGPEIRHPVREVQVATEYILPTEIAPDVSKLCRICMIKIEKNKSKSLFKRNNGIIIAEFLADSFKLQIQENDGFPQSVCIDCVKHIFHANALKNQALDSDSRLRHLFEPKPAVTISNEITVEPVFYADIKLEIDPENYVFAEPIQQPTKIEKPPKIETPIVTTPTVKSKPKKTMALSSSVRKPTKDDIYCCMCVNYFDSKEELMVHAATHKPVPQKEPKSDKEIDCGVCLRRYANLACYKFHMKQKYLAETHICSTCGKMHKRLRDLHCCERKHAGNAPRVKCNKCEQTFVSNTNLQIHMKIHLGIKEWVCDFCGKAFRLSSNLTIHRRTHTKERPLECKVCKKTFSWPTALAAHKRIHTGERPYTCKECGNTFQHKTTMKIHMRGHTGERPYKCTHCDKKFISGTKMRDHAIVHTGVKPFQCQLCNIAYYMRRSLGRHMMEKHSS